LCEIIENIDSQQYADFVLENGILYYENDGLSKLVVPCSFVPFILEAYHDDPLSGHYSGKKTYQLIGQKYFWMGMRKDIFSYCDS